MSLPTLFSIPRSTDLSRKLLFSSSTRPFRFSTSRLRSPSTNISIPGAGTVVKSTEHSDREAMVFHIPSVRPAHADGGTQATKNRASDLSAAALDPACLVVRSALARETSPKGLEVYHIRTNLAGDLPGGRVTRGETLPASAMLHE